MPSTPAEIEELLILADRLCDEGLSAFEAARLSQLLRSSEDLRERYLNYRDLHASLAWNGRGSRVSTSLFDEPAPPESPPARAWPYVVGRQAANFAASMTVAWRHRPLAASLALAMSLMLLIGLGWLAWPASPAAQLVRTCDAVWLADSKLLSPAEKSKGNYYQTINLSAGKKLRLTSGLAELRFRSGAIVVLEGPAAFEILGRNRGRLETGKLVAHVPPAARGFQVETPHARVIDLGTEFAMFVQQTSEPNGQHSSTEVHVLAGQVEVAAQHNRTGADSPSLQKNISSGAAVRAEAGLNSLTTIASQPERFVRSLPGSIVLTEDFESLPIAMPLKGEKLVARYERSLPNRKQSIRVVEAADMPSGFGRRVLEFRDTDADPKMANPVIDLALPDALQNQSLQLRFDFRILDPSSQPLVTIYNREWYVRLCPEVAIEGEPLGTIEPKKWYRVTIDFPAVSNDPAKASVRLQRWGDGQLDDPRLLTVSKVRKLPGATVRLGFYNPVGKAFPAGGLWQVDNVRVRTLESEYDLP